jgi:transcriptional regulator with XRE-family HTH domain
VDDVDEAWRLRRALGRELKARREAAGMDQPQLAARTQYSRSTIATLESVSGGAVARVFWERCDAIFGTGEMFARRWDEIQQHVQAARAAKAAARRRPGSRRPGTAGTAQLQALRTLRSGLDPGALRDARSAYARLGWPVARDPAMLELVTGTVVDVLEVPRAAGLLAISWWLDSGGSADPIRNLPAMPRPDQALAVISAGQSFYFLARAGTFPWPADRPLSPGTAGRAAGPVIGWHSHGSQVPLPPSRADGQLVQWAHLPSRGVWLASPVALLELLAKAVTVIRNQPQALSLPGGVLAVPARR